MLFASRSLRRREKVAVGGHEAAPSGPTHAGASHVDGLDQCELIEALPKAGVTRSRMDLGARLLGWNSAITDGPCVRRIAPPIPGLGLQAAVPDSARNPQDH